MPESQSAYSHGQTLSTCLITVMTEVSPGCCRDADKTAVRVNRVLNSVAELELLQAPGLPYSIPKEFNNRPRLTGQAFCLSDPVYQARCQLELDDCIERAVDLLDVCS